MGAFAQFYTFLHFSCTIIVVKKFIIAICIAVFATTNPASAITGDMTQDVQWANSMRANCVSAQQMIQQISRTDAALRINRGRAHEKMLKLMYAFNARVAANNKSMPALSEITANYEKRIATFRNNYDQYADAVVKPIKIDCKNQPVTFYEALADARAKRWIVHNDVQALDALHDQYENAVNSVAESIGGAE